MSTCRWHGDALIINFIYLIYFYTGYNILEEHRPAVDKSQTELIL